MTTSTEFTSAGAPEEPPSATEKLEEDAWLAGVAAAVAIRGAEVAAIVLLGLLIVPPLAILVVLVVGPLLVIALIAAVVTTPFLLVRHFRSPHGGHVSLFAHRLRMAGRALVDLAPHRIDAAARSVDPGRDRKPPFIRSA